MKRVAVIGVGNMGSKYATHILNGEVSGLELAAITRVRGKYREMLEPAIRAGLPIYETADELFAAVEEGALPLDAVIIATPHYAHREIAVRAFQNGLDVLSDKPSGVYSRQAREMEEKAEQCGRIFGMVFHQRTMPVYQKLHELVHSGIYGGLKRVSWVVTDWYRPEKYYTSVAWRGTWDKDGGGVLLNQCSHNLDLLQWICGMPVRVQGFCQEGRFHHVEVEDDVTAYLEWENGATGTFVSSTGDAPGINRLEISLDEAMLVCENGKLRIGEVATEMGGKEADYRKNSEDLFRKIRGTWTDVELPEAEPAYPIVLQAFSDSLHGTGENVAPGTEGRKSLILCNAVYLSSWEKRMVTIPEEGSAAEREFEGRFEEHLEEKRNS